MKTTFLYNVISASLAFILWGAWAYYVNCDNKGSWQLISALGQWTASFCIILVMVRARSKGEALLVLFNCDVIMGKGLKKQENTWEFIQNLEE